MKDAGRIAWLGLGLLLGVVGAWGYLQNARPALAANDRYEDFILCTGPVMVTPQFPSDGVWLLDYKAGKLLGTVIDRNTGKIINWAEVDLVSEFNIPPRQNVHFLMTTGTVTNGQSALYVAETTSGKFGVYTMGVRADGRFGLAIHRHDLTSFRANPLGG